MLTDKELKIAKQKYKDHIGNCRGRIDRLGNPIEFRLTFDQWIDIWLTSGHWHERGNKCGQYVMSRFNDLGHYELDNVEIKTVEENHLEHSQTLQWKKNHKVAMQKLAQKPEWRAKQKVGAQKNAQKPEWRANNKLINQNKSLEWRENIKLALQQRCNKQISCDGVIYESRIIAALALAPETRLTHGSKSGWLSCQMKKFPNRYFYVTKSE